MSATDDIREKICKETTSEKKMALLCVTLIAMVAILKLADPENIIINIIVAISSFIGGDAYGRRKIDPMPSDGNYTQTLTETQSRTEKPVMSKDEKKEA